MALFKKPSEYSVLQPAAVEVLESPPPAPIEVDALIQQERVVAGWAAQLSEVEGELARENVCYLGAARQQAGGETPAEPPSTILGRVAAMQIEADGVRSLRDEAKARLEQMHVEYTAALIAKNRENHTRRYHELCGVLDAASADAEKHFEGLAGALWRMVGATEALTHPSFVECGGGAAVGAAFDHVRGLRGKAFRDGRQMNENTYLEVPAIGPAKEGTA